MFTKHKSAFYLYVKWIFLAFFQERYEHIWMCLQQMVEAHELLVLVWGGPSQDGKT